MLSSRTESHFCLNNAGILGSVLHAEHIGCQRKLTSRNQTLMDVYFAQIPPRFRTNMALNTKGIFYFVPNISLYLTI